MGGGGVKVRMRLKDKSDSKGKVEAWGVEIPHQLICSR